MYCKVKNCRFPDYHVTRGHICGKCHEPAHGQIECRSAHAKELLKEFINDEIPLAEQCNIPLCDYKKFHTTEGHQCKNCRKPHAEDSMDCIHNKIVTSHVVDCPTCRTENKIKIGQKKMFGLEQTCVVCLDNPIEVYFPQCGHSCVCYNCFDKLNKM
jgi:hypothetical protein